MPVSDLNNTRLLYHQCRAKRLFIYLPHKFNKSVDNKTVELLDKSMAIKSSTGRWVVGENFYNRQNELRLLDRTSLLKFSAMKF